MATTPLPSVFKEFLSSLNAHSVEYLLIGGYAVIHYSRPRATGDLDVWVRDSPDNLERVCAAIREFGFRSAQPSDFTRKVTTLRMGREPFRIEVMTVISGVDFAECWPRRVTITLDGVAVPLIQLDDLKANKKASGRNKDLADLDVL